MFWRLVLTNRCTLASYTHREAGEAGSSSSASFSSGASRREGSDKQSMPALAPASTATRKSPTAAEATPTATHAMLKTTLS